MTLPNRAEWIEAIMVAWRELRNGPTLRTDAAQAEAALTAIEPLIAREIERARR
jgi:hypothetical protein